MRICVLTLFLMSLLFIGQTTADEPESAKPAPPSSAELLRQLQGKWKIRAIYLPSLSGTESFPEEVSFASENAEIEIQGNQVVVDGKVAATFANDLDLPATESEIGFKTWQLLLLTLPSGKGVLCSYGVFGEQWELAHTHRCSCHRGSGHILSFERAKE